MASDTPIQVRKIDTEHSIAEITDFGAQVLSWTPRGQNPVVWLSDQASFAGDTTVRGGIPICLPWFGNPKFSPAAPAGAAGNHGFAKTTVWEQVDSASSPAAQVPRGKGIDSPRPQMPGNGDIQAGAGAKAGYKVLTYRLSHKGGELFPQAFSTQLTIEVGETLRLTLEAVNTDDHPFRFEAVFHTYLGFSDLRQCELHGLEQAFFLDTLTDKKASEDQPITFNQSFDRIYDSLSDLEIYDPAWGRKIWLKKSGSKSTIVWTPWERFIKDFSDIPDEDVYRFAGIEFGNVREHALLLQPGQSHRLAMEIGVDSLVDQGQVASNWDLFVRGY